MTISYLIAELFVPRQHHAEFTTVMPFMQETMFDLYGWELVHASYPIFGETNRFVQIWRVPDATSVQKVMTDGALAQGHSPQQSPLTGPRLEQLFKQESPEVLFKLMYQRLQSLITDTRQVLSSSLPHDPEWVGLQTQILLVDAEGEPFLIEHSDLRKEFSDTEKDRGAELRALRRQRESLRWPKRAPSAEGGTGGSQTLRDLQEHLNIGATAASLPHEDGKTRALLFNLAGLKTSSVFHELKQLKQSENAPKLPKSGNGVVDLPAEKMFVATPWGSVYELTEEDLKRVVREIPEQERPGTQRRLAPLIKHGVTLASIPEEKDLVVGDGCMCYVINLSSYVSTPKERAACMEKLKSCLKQ